jgi:energy-coupling factor transport system ATP-binding protein
VLLVVGPSGSGKSTLARGIAGLLPEQFAGTWGGSLRVGDAEVARNDGEADASGAPAISTRSLGAGIVLQDPASQLVMERVGDDVAFGLESAAWSLEAMRARVPEALESVGLKGFEERRSTRLSGGEQQRVALAGVLAPRPRVLVLDEPTAHLDPEGTAAVLSVIAALRARRDTTVVLIEHRAKLAWPLADLVLALDDEGRPIDAGAPEGVLQRSGRRMGEAGIWLPDDRADADAVSRVGRDAGAIHNLVAEGVAVERMRQRLAQLQVIQWRLERVQRQVLSLEIIERVQQRGQVGIGLHLGHLLRLQS